MILCNHEAKRGLSSKRTYVPSAKNEFPFWYIESHTHSIPEILGPNLRLLMTSHKH
jgi:hypothetical protein